MSFCRSRGLLVSIFVYPCKATKSSILWDSISVGTGSVAMLKSFWIMVGGSNSTFLSSFQINLDSDNSSSGALFSVVS